MSHRIQQIESTLRRALAEVLQSKIADPRIVGLVSITKLTVAPDLKNAYVYVSILPEKYERRTIAGLRHATRHIQRLAREKVALRVVPHLDFRLDESLKKQAALEQAIREGVSRTEHNAAQAASPETMKPTEPPSAPPQDPQP